VKEFDALEILPASLRLRPDGSATRGRGAQAGGLAAGGAGVESRSPTSTRASGRIPHPGRFSGHGTGARMLDSKMGRDPACAGAPAGENRCETR